MNTVASLVASLIAGIAGAPDAVVDAAPFRDQPPAAVARPAGSPDIIADAPTGNLRALPLRELARARFEGVVTEGPIASRPVSLAALHAVHIADVVSDAPTPAPRATRAPKTWQLAQADGVVVSVP